MDAKDLRDLVEFSPDGPLHHALFESAHLWSEIVCLERTHQIGPLVDPDSDAIFTVVAGEIAIQVDRHRKRLRQWGAVLVPAKTEVTISNASVEPAVVLIVAAPPPVPRPAPD